MTGWLEIVATTIRHIENEQLVTAELAAGFTQCIQCGGVNGAHTSWCSKADKPLLTADGAPCP